MKKRNGLAAVKSGQLLEAARRGGQIQGRIQGAANVESGQINVAAKVGGIAASHARFHAEKSNPKCMMCCGMTTQEIYNDLWGRFQK